MSFEDQVLKAHNQFRAQHGCPALVVDQNLNKIATEWAQHLLEINKMEHRQNPTYGENIYMCMGKDDITGMDPVKAWYDEIRDFKFGKDDFKPTTGHFTQLIWKTTKKLGVGKAQKDKTIYVVCNYDPMGNEIGNFKANVPPKQKK